MRKQTFKAALFIFLTTIFVGFFSQSFGSEQELFKMMLDPRHTDFDVKANIETVAYFDQDVDRQSKDFGYFEFKGNAIARVYEGDSNEWFVHSSFKALEVDTQARLPRAGKLFPDDLWDFDVGATYRHWLDNNWMAGGTIRVGSNADEPFHSFDEVSVAARGFLRIPSADTNAWLFYLNYDNEQPGTYGKLPLPGFGYLWVPSEQVQVFAGLPVMGVRAEPIVDELEVSVFYAIPRTLYANVTWKPTEWMHVYGGFDWKTELYRRAEREDYGERLSLHKKEGKVGLKFLFEENFTLDVFGGFSFDRFIYEGETHDDRDDDRIKIDDGPFAGINFGLKF